MSDEEKKQISLDLERVSPASANESTDIEIDDSHDILEWVSHPAKKNFKITAIVTAFLITLVVIVYYMTYSIWFSVFLNLYINTGSTDFLKKFHF